MERLQRKLHPLIIAGAADLGMSASLATNSP
jgi:hypothetical protein